MGDMNDALSEAAKSCGGLAKLADTLGLSIQVVSNWRKRGVPIAHCAAIEAATNGSVTRRDLRPDDWRAIWPELAKRKPKRTTVEG